MTYLRNVWYCAGHSRDLTDKPLGRIFLDKPTVIYRDSNGCPVMLDGACPHRFAPLSQGVVFGDDIMCPYHGLRFNPEGRCVLNPHGDGFIPPSARVNGYRMVEKDGLLWFWAGDPDLADEGRIMDMPWVTSPAYTVILGYMHTRGNYQLVIDNLLDLTHAPFIHQGTLSARPEPNRRVEFDFRVASDGIIHADYLIPNTLRPSPLLLPLWGDRPSDNRLKMSWRPASSLELHIHCWPAGQLDEDIDDTLHQPSYHLLTPETETTTHYFYASGRNLRLDDTDYDTLVVEMGREAFEGQDEPMIAACQRMMGEVTDLFDLKPAVLKTDVAAIQARRALAKLIRLEQEQTPVAKMAELAPL